MSCQSGIKASVYAELISTCAPFKIVHIQPSTVSLMLTEDGHRPMTSVITDEHGDQCVTNTRMSQKHRVVRVGHSCMY
ncbi:hypothetical protein ACTXT7_009950 [Hymenolepis weldensis]